MSDNSLILISDEQAKLGQELVQHSREAVWVYNGSNICDGTTLPRVDHGPAAHMARTTAKPRRAGVGAAEAGSHGRKPQMKCPYCAIDFHDDWRKNPFHFGDNVYNAIVVKIKSRDAFWQFRMTVCSNCRGGIIQIAPFSLDPTYQLNDWRMVQPLGATRGLVSSEVPPAIAKDYVEVCNVLPSALNPQLHYPDVASRTFYTALDIAVGIYSQRSRCSSTKVILRRLFPKVCGAQSTP